MQEWNRDLAEIRVALPCKLARCVVPRIIVLPTWWPAQHGVWIYFCVIFVGRSVVNAPTDARRYLIGHEYGHIYCGHVLLHYAYWMAVSGLVMGMLVGAPIAVMLCGLLAMMTLLVGVWPSAIERRECQADAIAAQSWGAQRAMTGAVWFMGQRKESRNHLRSVRLALLQSYARDEDHAIIPTR